MMRVALCKHLSFNWIPQSTGVGVGLGAPEAASTASDAPQDGAAPVRVVMVSLGVRASEGSTESAGAGRESALMRTKAWPLAALKRNIR